MLAWGSYFDMTIEICLFCGMMVLAYILGDLNNLKEVGKLKLKENKYDPDIFVSEVGDLSERLDLGILPNEIIDISKKETFPCDVISIFNTGTLFFRVKIGEKYESLVNETDKHDIRSRFNAFILKALELNAIQKELK